jgi:hypothetical protein
MVHVQRYHYSMRLRDCLCNFEKPYVELVFHHYVQPHGKAFQKVYHDCYISSWVPYAVSSLAAYL